MTGEQDKDNRFGVIAVELNFVDQGKMDKALVVQTRIFEKTKIKTPIGEILMEMGVITAAQRDEILRTQQEIDGKKQPERLSETALKKSPSAQTPKKNDCVLNINVSKDRLTAWIYNEGPVPVTAFDVNDIKIMLHSEGILYGIADDGQIKGFLNGEFSVGENWTIASGTEPIPDAPPEIRYHFDTDPLKIGTLTEAGLMDWKDRGQLPQVRAGDLLAEKIPGPPGKEGMDVYGKKMPVPKAREMRFKCTKGASRSDDGMQVYAAVSGIPSLSITGELAVMPNLNIQGDISLETGHVTFDGHIEVAGAVEKGYRVKGGSLRADEIRYAQIDIEGDITAINGIFGATIRCGGNLKAGHIHNSTIVVTGDMAVEKEIIESKIEANGRCLVNDGIVISSIISAKMGITAMDIGTQASNPSELIVGIDRQLERESDEVKATLQSLKAENKNLPKLIEDLKKRSDQINTRLGEVALEQDKCMVRLRNLQENLEAGKLKPEPGTGAKLQNTMAELQARQNAYDHDVAQLMEEDESITREIAAAEKAIPENTAAIEELGQRLTTITETLKQNSGLAAVKIGGNVFSGTKITGPNSVLVLQEDLGRLTIMETDKPDHEGVKRWRFELNPFR